MTGYYEPELTPLAAARVAEYVSGLPAILQAPRPTNAPFENEFIFANIEVGHRVTVRVVVTFDYDETGLPIKADARVSGYLNAPVLREWAADALQESIDTASKMDYHVEVAGVTYAGDHNAAYVVYHCAHDYDLARTPANAQAAIARYIEAGRLRRL